MENLKTSLGLIGNMSMVLLIVMALVGLMIDLIDKKDRNPKETLLNIAVFMIGSFTNRYLFQGIQLSALHLFEPYRIINVETSTLMLIASFIAVDFVYYWKHRIEHHVSILWAEHSVHHSSQEFNFSTALRLPWISPIFGWIFFIPLVLIGVSAQVIVISLLLNLLYQYFIHSPTFPKMKILDGILNTPSDHRVHHASNPEYIDKNFDGVLIVWDRLFGTFAREVNTPVYGAEYKLETINPIKVNFYPFEILVDRIKSTKGLMNRCKTLFAPPSTL